jgi:hypothetical protein
MVQIGQWSSDKSDAYDSHPKTMPTVFLSIGGAILINWLTPGEKFNNGQFCEK